MDGYGMGIITRNGYPVQKCDRLPVGINGYWAKETTVLGGDPAEELNLTKTNDPVVIP
tara:strand:- start:188 stop:361 length:174 start_codon:yes stop_codon:yes gene_type:complete